MWIEKERRRWAERFGIPFAEEGLPDGFPNRTLEVCVVQFEIKRYFESVYFLLQD